MKILKRDIEILIMLVVIVAVVAIVMVSL